MLRIQTDEATLPEDVRSHGDSYEEVNNLCNIWVVWESSRSNIQTEN